MVKKDRRGKAGSSDISLMVQEARKWREEMHSAMGRENWKQAIGNGCRALMHMANAVTVQVTGEYFKGQDHNRAAGFLAETVGYEAKGPARQMQLVMKMKQNADYGLTSYTRKDADDAVKRVDRFFSWADKQIPRGVRGDRI